jgi:hypothetical protein
VASEHPDGEPFAGAGPLSFTATAREAWHLYRRRPLPAIALFTVLYFGVALLLVALSRPDPTDVGQIVIGLTLGLVLPIAGSLATAVAVILMHDAYLGRGATLAGAVTSVRGAWREVFSAALLSCMLTFLLSTALRILVVTPLGVLAFLLLTSLPPILFGPPIVLHVVVLERRSLAEALGRARALMAGNWRRLLVYWVGLAFLVGIGVLFVGSLLLIALGGSELALGLFNALTSGLLIPFVVAFVLVGFLDIRYQLDRPDSSEAHA